MVGSFIVFSDYDGTIADENTGMTHSARRALRTLKKARIPLVIVSSKTFLELQDIYRRLHMKGAFVFENGGGIAYPQKKGYDIEPLGISAEKLKELVPFLESVAKSKIEILADMEEARLCAYAGLSLCDAYHAKTRLFSMPFIFQKGRLDENELSMIASLLEEKKLRLRWGGKFYHLIPLGAGKGDAVRRVCGYYEHLLSGYQAAAGIGNSENDFDMLDAVEHPFLVRNSNSGIDYNTVPYPVTEQYGGEGFYEAVEKIIALADDASRADGNE